MSDKANENNANPLDVISAAKEEVITSSDGEQVYTRSAIIMHRENYSEFRKANMAFLSDGASKIGGAIRSAERMRVNKAEMDKYMPGLIGESPLSTNYVRKFDEYFSNFAVVVPPGGKTLNTSIVFNDAKSLNMFEEANNNILKRFAQAFDKVEEGPNKDKELDAIYKTKDDAIVLLESKIHNFGYPENIGDYILWRYCLVYRDVANDEARIAKSGNIRFYIFDKQLKAKQEEAKFAIQSNATLKYADLLTNQDELSTVLWALSNVHTIDIKTAAKGPAGNTTRSMMLDKIVKVDPQGFLTMASNKDLATRAFIEKAIAHGMVNRIPNTQVVMDKEGNTIGSTLAETIVYFKNREINGDYISRIENQLKSL